MKEELGRKIRKSVSLCSTWHIQVKVLVKANENWSDKEESYLSGQVRCQNICTENMSESRDNAKKDQ